jgi:hypothetical protein
MNTIPGPKLLHSMTRIVVLLIIVALIGGMLGCGPSASSYNLAISSTAGGSVTTPGEGTHTYDAGVVVDLVAEADAGYQFLNWTGSVGTVGDRNAAVTTIKMNSNYSITANFERQFVSRVAGGGFHTVGLKSDGTVVAVGRNDDGQCDVGGWTGITQIAAGLDYTVGLRANGKVVAVGDCVYGECAVGDWTDIIQVAVFYLNTVGLKSDGTVVRAGECGLGNVCEVSGWEDIIQVAAGMDHIVGLKSDGSAVAVGASGDGRLNVGGWTGYRPGRRRRRSHGGDQGQRGSARCGI